MSWLGVKYTALCRDERVKLGTRLVFINVGVRIEYRRITTSPTSLGDLKWLTLMSVEQIRRALDDLEEWRLVVRLRRGKNAIYALPGMAGPLFALDPGDPVKMTDFVLDALPREIGQDARKVTGRMPGSRRRMTDFAGRRAGGVLFPEGTSTYQVPTTTEERAVAGEFLTWWQRTYPLYNRGAVTSIDADAVAIVAALLKTRSATRLREMAAVLWLVDASEEPWIALKTDRSLRILRYRADWLDLRAAQMPEWWQACEHPVKCGAYRDCAEIPKAARG